MEKIFKTNISLMLPIEFYLQPTEIVAKDLLGKALVKIIPDGNMLAGVIVETEAYLASDDAASHSAVGLTKRNSTMFGEGGLLYVYLIYGLHHCINVVTGDAGLGSAVLIRAIEPISGIEYMKQSRTSDVLENLCKGPANLSKAFGFSLKDNNTSLLSSKLFIKEYQDFKDKDITVSKRIGIKKSADLPLRFFIKDNIFVSGRNVKKIRGILNC